VVEDAPTGLDGRAGCPCGKQAAPRGHADDRWVILRGRLAVYRKGTCSASVDVGATAEDAAAPVVRSTGVSFELGESPSFVEGEPCTLEGKHVSSKNNVM